MVDIGRELIIREIKQIRFSKKDKKDISVKALKNYAFIMLTYLEFIKIKSNEIKPFSVYKQGKVISSAKLGADKAKVEDYLIKINESLRKSISNISENQLVNGMELIGNSRVDLFKKDDEIIPELLALEILYNQVIDPTPTKAFNKYFQDIDIVSVLKVLEIFNDNGYESISNLDYIIGALNVKSI